MEGDRPAQSLHAEPSLSKEWKETGQLSLYRRNRASPRSGRRRASSVLTGGAENLQEVEGDGPAQSLQAEPSLSKKWKETGQLSPYRRTEPHQELEGDGPAQSLQPQPSLSKKWKETGQLSPYSPNRASPRSGRRRASSVFTGGAENLQEVEGDGPAPSLQAEPSISQKWKETGQLCPHCPNRASPRSGRRRASSVLTAGAEKLQEVERDGPAQSLQAKPSLSKKWKETGHLSPYRRTEPLQEVEGDGPAQSPQPQQSLSKKWKETGQLCPHCPNRASPRSGRRRASSVLTGGAENLQEVERDGPAQSLQAKPSLSKKWKETGHLSPYRRTEPLQEVEGDGPAQSPQPQQSLSKKWKETGQLSPYRRSRESPRRGMRRASSVLTGGTEPLPEVEGDGPALSPQTQQSLSKKWKETGQLSPYWRSRETPRSGRRRSSSVPTGGTEPSKKWKETGQLSPYRLNLASPRSGRRRASSVPTAST